MNKLCKVFRLVCFLAILDFSSEFGVRGEGSTLPAILKVLEQSDNVQLQLDILRGLSKAFEGVQSKPMPEGWSQLETVLAESDHSEVRELSEKLALTFGSQRALDSLKRQVIEKGLPATTRQNALKALLGSSERELTPTLFELMGDGEMRRDALRALGRFNDPQIPTRVLAAYNVFNDAEKRDALTTLSGRRAFGEQLLQAVQGGGVSQRDLSAEILRQLKSHKDETIDSLIESVWGTYNKSDADKLNEIARYRNVYRAGGSTPGDASRGRGVYARTCQQCHKLFDVGGAVGPDLTGSNRRDLNYLLENIIDPNAVIPNEYRSSTLETVDGRVITGLVRSRRQESVTIQTQNETMVIPADSIDSLDTDPLSMMPDGLLLNLGDQEVRDLLYYLRGPAQAPLVASESTADLFFNAHNLSNWDGNFDLWRVEGGEIVGKSEGGLKKNEFLASQMIVNDFRLTFEVKLTPNSENSGAQFRSELEPSGSVKGYQADIGEGWWGKLYEEHGRALLWDKAGDQYVRENEWNTYEILAIGSKIKTAVNGSLCVDLDDPKGAKSGIVAFQLHSGGPLEVRFRNLKLEIDPEPVLTTQK
jgi:putative heme-binding domain-containing protein